MKRIGIKIIIFSLFVFLFGVEANAGTIIRGPAYLGLTNGLVGCWSFDGSYTKVPDCSGNGNTGTISGGAKRVEGKIGQAMSFDGVDDTITITDPASGILDFGTNSFTYSMWVYRERAVDFEVIFHKGAANDASAGYDVECVESFGKVCYACVGDGVDNKCGFFELGTVSLNEWHLLTFVLDKSANVLKSYKDGVFTADADATGLGSVNSNNNLTFSDSSSLRGRLDDIRIYNRALSARDIERLYLIGLGSKANRSLTNSSFDKGLVGYWTMDGGDIFGTSVRDKSGSGNHGTNNGATKIEGKVGQALNFDGSNNDIVDAQSGSSLDDIRTITISAWIKPDSFGESSLGRILDKNDTANVGWDFIVCNDGGTPACSKSLRFEQIFDSTSTAGLWNANNVITLGVWTHVAIVYDNNSLTNEPLMYINGSSVAVTEVRDPTGTYTSDGAQSLTIGNRANLARDFHGSIDDVRVYKRLLSAAEINRLYQTTQSKYNASKTDSLTQGLVGYWTFDGSNIFGTSARDTSGQGNHGTITGSIKSAGKIGQALDFDGVDDFVNVTTSVGQFGTSDFSVSFWTKYDKSSGGRAVGKRDVCDASVGFFDFSMNFNGTVGFEVHGPGATEGGASTNRNDIGNNSWHHIVGTRSGANSRIYIDGVLDNSVVDSVTVDITSSSDLLIGGEDACSDFFQASIDDVRIYNRTLSAAEINKLYQMGR